MIMNDQLENTRKEVVVACFLKVLPQIFLEGTEEDHENSLSG
jgi:hypothetical protein